jgi:hemerythrin-like domain-containing protein
MPPSLDDGPQGWFTADHRACDALFGAVEDAGDDALAAAAAFSRFDQALRRHLDMEEGVLFPAFERATGMTGGPTAVMRMEHDQMRGLLDQMGDAVGSGRLDALLDQGDTLLMVIQQHNVKEEGMLYPMMEMHLRRDWPALAARLGKMAG